LNSDTLKISIATVTAMMKVEELVGLNEDEFYDEFTVGGSVVDALPIAMYNGFPVLIEKDEEHDSIPEDYRNALVMVRVTVLDIDGSGRVLCRQENIVNIAGGF